MLSRAGRNFPKQGGPDMDRNHRKLGGGASIPYTNKSQPIQTSSEVFLFFLFRYFLTELPDSPRVNRQLPSFILHCSSYENELKPEKASFKATLYCSS